ncbi:hypothetical protein U1Q18_027123 [Sarracenia purpurea var. burkii]
MLRVRDIPLWVIDLTESRQMTDPLASMPTNYQQQSQLLLIIISFDRDLLNEKSKILLHHIRVPENGLTWKFLTVGALAKWDPVVWNCFAWNQRNCFGGTGAIEELKAKGCCLALVSVIHSESGRRRKDFSGKLGFARGGDKWYNSDVQPRRHQGRLSGQDPHRSGILAAVADLFRETPASDSDHLQASDR